MFTSRLKLSLVCIVFETSDVSFILPFVSLCVRLFTLRIFVFQFHMARAALLAAISLCGSVSHGSAVTSY